MNKVAAGLLDKVKKKTWAENREKKYSGVTGGKKKVADLPAEARVIKGGGVLRH